MTGIESYLAHCKANGQHARTVKFKKSHLHHYEEFGGSLVDYILYLKMKGYNIRTINEKYAAIKAYMEFMDETGNSSLG